MKTRGIAYWAKIHQVDTKYDQWNILLHVDKEEADKLKAVGLKVKMEENDEGEIVRSIRFKRYLNKRGKATGQNPKPICVDAALNPFTEPIGNGSEVIVLHKPYKWNNSFGTGVGTDLEGVQVVNLVEYVPEGGEAADDSGAIADTDGGFEVIGPGLEDETKKKESVGEMDF